MPEIRVKLDKTVYDVVKKIIDERGITWSQLINSVLQEFIDRYREQNELPLDLEINSLYFRVVKIFSLARRIDDTFRLLQRTVRVADDLALPFAIKLNELRSKLLDEASRISMKMKEKIIQEIGEWKWYEYESEYRRPKYFAVGVSDEEKKRAEEIIRSIRAKRVKLDEEEEG